MRPSSSARTTNTKEILIEAGADEWRIYAKGELRILVAQNGVAPTSQHDLKEVHTLKRAFDGMIVENR